MESMKHPEREGIDKGKKLEEDAIVEKTLKSTAVDDPEVINTYLSGKDEMDNKHDHQDWKREQEAFKNPEMGALKIYGRMSP